MNFTKIINLKTLTVGAIAGVMAFGLTSCSNAPNSPGYEYMPDMYRDGVLKYYNTYVLNGDTLQSAMKPVAGTIARGCMPGIPAGMDYEKAGVYLKNPILYSDAVLNEGEAIYGKFCVHCHGDAGKGDGKVGLKLPGAPPAYDGPLKNLPEGKMFYTITNGKGLMGSHASQLSVEERWKVIYYVQKLQGHTPGQAIGIADSTGTEMTAGAIKTPDTKKEEKNQNKI